MSKKEEIIVNTLALKDKLDSLSLDFSGYVYDPLDYAWDMHRKWLDLSIRDGQKCVLMGMNPGPFGMTQTGVPFGDIVAVRDYLGLEGTVEKPKVECPSRPIEGMSLKRREMSGRRIWGAIESAFTRDEFFSFFTVVSWCPLAFLDEKGRNVTPDKLSGDDRAKIFPVCDDYIKRFMDTVDPEILVGIGNFATGRLRGFGRKVMSLAHPSPLSRQSAEWYPEKAAGFLKGIKNGSIR